MVEGVITIPKMLCLSSEDTLRVQIAHSVSPDIENSTVAKICQKADISRQTFYKYFSSKYDIAIWYSMFLFSSCALHPTDNSTWEESLEQIFSFHLQEKETVLRLALPCTKGKSTFVSFPQEADIWGDGRKRQIMESLREFGHDNFDNQLAYTIDMYIALESATFTKWIAEGMIAPPKTMAGYLTSCIPVALGAILGKPSNEKTTRKPSQIVDEVSSQLPETSSVYGSRR